MKDKKFCLMLLGAVFLMFYVSNINACAANNTKDSIITNYIDITCNSEKHRNENITILEFDHLVEYNGRYCITKWNSYWNLSIIPDDCNIVVTKNYKSYDFQCLDESGNYILIPNYRYNTNDEEPQWSLYDYRYNVPGNSSENYYWHCLVYNYSDGTIFFDGSKDEGISKQSLYYNEFLMYTRQLPKLTDAEARQFLSFVNNSYEYETADLSEDVYYQLLIGDYSELDTVDKVKATIESFSNFVRTTMNQQVLNSSYYVENFSMDLLGFLENRLDESLGFGKIILDEYIGEFENEEISASLLDDMKNHSIDLNNHKFENQDEYIKFIKNYVECGFTEHNEIEIEELDEEYMVSLQYYMEKGFLGVVTRLEGTEVAENLGYMVDAYKKVLSGVEDGFEYSENLVAAIEALWVIMGSEINARCTYFNVYLSNRKNCDTADDEIFQLILDYDIMALKENNIWGQYINGLTWISGKDSWDKHIDGINMFAEYLFQLEQCLEVSEHKYITEYVAATCENDGYIRKYCSKCTSEHIFIISERLNHSYVKEKNLLPTCVEVGYEGEEWCERCKYQKCPRKIIEALGHEYVSQITIPPTIEKMGEMTYTCSRCQDSYTEAIEKLQTKNPFSDVKVGEWYVDAIQYVYDNGLMSGSNGLFKPTGDTTRAQVVTTLYNLEGKPAVTDYSAVAKLVDVQAGQWYTDAVCWACSVGVANGNNATKMFNMNTLVTRQQLATFFYNYASYKGKDTSIRGDYFELAGADEVASYAVETMKWAYGTGLITGSKTTVNGATVYNLKPTGTATRAQLASILQRFCENNNL